MAESPPEYTVRDYSAVDKQIEEVARREKTLTDRMRIQNYAKLAIIAGGLMLAAGILFVLISWGIRIMKGAPEIRIIESRGTNQEERTTDNQDVRQIFENEKQKDLILTQNKERILNMYDEVIRNLEDDNQQLNTYLEQEEKSQMDFDEELERALQEMDLEEEEKLEKVVSAPVQKQEKRLEKAIPLNAKPVASMPASQALFDVQLDPQVLSIIQQRIAATPHVGYRPVVQIMKNGNVNLTFLKL